MPEQRDLRADLKHVNEYRASLEYHEGDDLPWPGEVCDVATHALERAIVAEEALALIIPEALAQHVHLCHWCHKQPDCGESRFYGGKQLCFIDAALAQARAKVGL